MPRPERPPIPDGVFHVTARGVEGRAIFLDEADRVVARSLLETAVRRFGWVLYAYTQMTTHFHLVVQTPRANISRGMQWLNGVYAQDFNGRHDRRGHLFDGRFRSTPVESDRHLWLACLYAVDNPVRAGIVDDPAAWPWTIAPFLPELGRRLGDGAVQVLERGERLVDEAQRLLARREAVGAA